MGCGLDDSRCQGYPRPSSLSTLYRLKHSVVSLLISIIYKWGMADACWSTQVQKEIENIEQNSNQIL